MVQIDATLRLFLVRHVSDNGANFEKAAVTCRFSLQTPERRFEVDAHTIVN